MYRQHPAATFLREKQLVRCIRKNFVALVLNNSKNRIYFRMTDWSAAMKIRRKNGEKFVYQEFTFNFIITYSCISGFRFGAIGNESEVAGKKIGRSYYGKTA
jgi:hypothetical protein